MNSVTRHLVILSAALLAIGGCNEPGPTTLDPEHAIVGSWQLAWSCCGISGLPMPAPDTGAAVIHAEFRLEGTMIWRRGGTLVAGSSYFLTDTLIEGRPYEVVHFDSDGPWVGIGRSQVIGTLTDTTLVLTTTPPLCCDIPGTFAFERVP